MQVGTELDGLVCLDHRGEDGRSLLQAVVDDELSDVRGDYSA